MTDQTFGNILWNFLATVSEFMSSLWSKANRDLQHFAQYPAFAQDELKFGWYSKWVTGAVRGSRCYSEMKKKSFKLVTNQILVIICQAC